MFPFSSRGNGGRPVFDFGLFSEVDTKVDAEVIAVEGGGNKWDDAEMIFEILLNGMLSGCCWSFVWGCCCCCCFKSLFIVGISFKSWWFVICSRIGSIGPECTVEEESVDGAWVEFIGIGGDDELDDGGDDDCSDEGDDDCSDEGDDDCSDEGDDDCSKI